MQETLNTFIAEYITSIKSDYRWRVNEIHLPNGVNLDPATNYEQSLQLKYQLNSLFVKGDLNERLKIIKYYTWKWGRIRNTDEMIRIYSTMDCEALIDFKSKQGIASWSKALCVRDPKTYAIFDARVSATLNLLLLKSTDETEKLFFPRLPSKNPTITRINKLIQSREVKYIHNREVYRLYLNLIQNTSKYVGTDIHTVEMILFSHPENLFAALNK
jgi:hypothetical protein